MILAHSNDPCIVKEQTKRLGWNTWHKVDQLQLHLGSPQHGFQNCCKVDSDRTKVEIFVAASHTFWTKNTMKLLPPAWSLLKMDKYVYLHCWILVIKEGDKWVLISQHQLVPSARDNTDMISRYHIICMVNHMPKWSNLEMMYFCLLINFPFNLLLMPYLAKFGARGFYTTGRFIPQNMHRAKHIHYNRCIYAKTRTNRNARFSQGGSSALNLHLFSNLIGFGCVLYLTCFTFGNIRSKIFY